MRVEFKRSGGFTGMHINTTIDTETLSSEQAKELESLIVAASFFELPAKTNIPPKNADRFIYRISIESEGKKHTVETDDEIAPDSLRPLLRRLTVLARSGSRPQR